MVIILAPYSPGVPHRVYTYIGIKQRKALWWTAEVLGAVGDLLRGLVKGSEGPSTWGGAWAGIGNRQ